MSRAKWKGPFIKKKSLTNFKKLSQKPTNLISTKSRTGTILPKFIDHFFSIHNGTKHLKKKIMQGMVGFKLGQFIATRKEFYFKKRKKKKWDKKLIQFVLERVRN